MPSLSKLAREEGGRAKIIQYGRYLTVLLCLGQGMLFCQRAGNIRQSCFTGFRASWCSMDNHLVVSLPDGD